ncbi:hypothetical protein IW147_006304 [Coemansia sp. RSA 720]|nr:hypothetical protein IW147_006304 [Coemansia sp. RSA 720]
MKDGHLVMGETQQHEAWAETAMRDESLLQALKSAVLRPLLQPSPWAAKSASRSCSRSSTNRPKQAAVRALASVPRKQYGAAAGIGRLRTCFVSQMLHGCTNEDCHMSFCQGNSKYARRLQAMEQAVVEEVAVELARRAMEQPERAELQPHTENELVQVISEGECGTTFMQRFARAMQRTAASQQATESTSRRLSGQHVAAAVKSIMGRGGDDDGLALGVSRLDAQTAPLVAAIGGRLLGNTVEVAFSSRSALAQSFVAADAALGVDVVAAIDFIERAYAQGTERQLIDALRRSLAAAEHPGEFDADAHMLALGVLAVGVARTDTGVLRRQITRRLVEQMFPNNGGGTERFAHDSDERRAWISWWTSAPPGVVRTWASGLRSDAAAATGRLLGGLTSDSVVAQRVATDPVRWTGALELLRILSEAASATVGASVFVCPEFLAQFDLTRELQRWIDHMRDLYVSARRMKRDSKEPPLFGPFYYPFAFELADKQRLQAAESYERMRQRYLSAHDRQAELLQSQRMLNIDTQAEDAVRADAESEWPLLAAQSTVVARACMPYLVLAVRRDRLVQDTVDLLQADAAQRSHARFPLKVRFVAGGEDGVDMGGVQKELFATLVPQLLAPDRGLFEPSDPNSMFLWPRAAAPHELLDFEAVGAVLGLAFVNGVTLDAAAVAPLAPLLVRQMAFEPQPSPLTLDALLALTEPTFPSLVAGLQQLLAWDEVEGRVEDVFCRVFEVTVPDPLRVLADSPAARIDVPGTATFELVPGGADIDVTSANRHEYVRRHLEFVAFENVREQINAVRTGFMRVADGVVFRMVRAAELEQWLCASAEPVSAAELERATMYEEYTPAHPVVRRFWRVVASMPPAQLAKLLAFVTASDRVPLGGYSGLTFVVQRNGPDSDRLPSALTCFGRLLLPAYSTDERMRDRLVTAIENAAGFGLV